MATDIRISTGLFSHPKWLRLTFRTGAEAGVALLRLWTNLGLMDSVDGRVGSAEDVELLSGFDQAVEKFSAAGFLDEVDGVFYAHDWKTHQPWASQAGKRKADAENAAARRWAKKAGSQRIAPQDVNAPRMRGASSVAMRKTSRGISNEDAPFLSLNPQEEKGDVVNGEHPPPAPSENPPPPPEPAVSSPVPYTRPDPDAMRAMMAHLGEVCGMNPESAAHARGLYDAAEQLARDYGPQDTAVLVEYFTRFDFRGPTGIGDRLTLRQAVETIEKAKLWAANGRPARIASSAQRAASSARIGSHQPPPPQDPAAAHQARLAAVFAALERIPGAVTLGDASCAALEALRGALATQDVVQDPEAVRAAWDALADALWDDFDDVTRHALKRDIHEVLLRAGVVPRTAPDDMWIRVRRVQTMRRAGGASQEAIEEVLRCPKP